MNLTEPHCGTDLGLIRTKAEPQADGSYKITGTKIFISSGEHDLAENIIHLVLAKIAGAPDNVKGISLFIVPKFLVNDDGSLGRRATRVICGSIEHKMGIHGNSTCVMNYDGATGWLVGEEKKGLAAMFIMMNAARLGVGLQGLAQGEVAYQNAVAYAKDRRQGRALTGPRSASRTPRPTRSFVHPDVRRMLMEAQGVQRRRARAGACGARCRSISRARRRPRRSAQTADDLLGAADPGDQGLSAPTRASRSRSTASRSIGGHGYIREWGMEQFVRDARIAQIYEGTNGIQAMDLVGRKLGANGGRAIQAFFKLVGEEAAAAKADAATRRPGRAAREAPIGDLQAATMWLMQNGMANPNNAGAARLSLYAPDGHRLRSA